mmetsp:Transcript_11595/g.21424  ORF Transcript_11595/g.21424 Transcript_11595/m.21424 type:complete len:124 (+) Transcript_11595:637-1008(+)
MFKLRSFSLLFTARINLTVTTSGLMFPRGTTSQLLTTDVTNDEHARALSKSRTGGDAKAHTFKLSLSCKEGMLVLSSIASKQPHPAPKECPAITILYPDGRRRFLMNGRMSSASLWELMNTPS